MSLATRSTSEPQPRLAALLDARAAALAARPSVAEKPVETAAFLVCTCGSERYGLPLSAVAGVFPERPCTHLPDAPGGVRGITAMAGVIVTVLDLAICLGLGSGSAEMGAGHMVSLRSQEPPVALAVDRVVGIARIDAVLARPSDRDALGRGPLVGYAPPGSDGTGDVREGFSLIDVPTLVAGFLT